ncbi:MAG: hypothetical protein ACI8QS_001729, partial [Planctomycetota bacterium]
VSALALGGRKASPMACPRSVEVARSGRLIGSTHNM